MAASKLARSARTAPPPPARTGPGPGRRRPLLDDPIIRGDSGISALCAAMAIGVLACQQPAPAAPLPCARDADCEASRCALIETETETETESGLYCSPADGAEEATTCAGAADCLHGLCLIGNVCAAPCLDDDDCDEGSECLPAHARLGERGALAVRACVAPMQLPLHVQWERAVRSNAVDTDGGTVLLPRADGTTLFILEHLQDDRFPFSTTCRPPLCPLRLRRVGDMEPLFDSEEQAQLLPIAEWPYSFPLTVYVGNTLELPTSDDGYELELRSELAGDLRVTTMRWEPDGQLLLDLNLFYAGASELQPEGARGPAPIEQALSEVERLYQQVGIELGDVNQIEVPSDLLRSGATFADPEDPRAGFSELRRGYGVWPELPALFRLSTGIRNGGVNVFLLGSIEALGGDGAVAGLSGGTPGPMGMQGSGASGIALSTDALVDDPTRLGRTLAHELAHFLGLFHTSEADGSQADPLSDTENCPPELDTNADGLLSVAECGEHGADNLMFWAAGAGDTLTEQQGEVLRRAPILRALDSDL